MQNAAPDTEDGISLEVSNRLRGRGKNASQSVMDWKEIWHTLFPEDEAVPDSGRYLFQRNGSKRLIGAPLDFKDVVEDHEIFQSYGKARKIGVTPLCHVLRRGQMRQLLTFPSTRLKLKRFATFLSLA